MPDASSLTPSPKTRPPTAGAIGVESGSGGIRTPVGISQQIYNLPRLATPAHSQGRPSAWMKCIPPFGPGQTGLWHDPPIGWGWRDGEACDAAGVARIKSGLRAKSRLEDLNLRPALYKSAALPLS